MTRRAQARTTRVTWGRLATPWEKSRLRGSLTTRSVLRKNVQSSGDALAYGVVYSAQWCCSRGIRWTTMRLCKNFFKLLLLCACVSCGKNEAPSTESKDPSSTSAPQTPATTAEAKPKAPVTAEPETTANASATASVSATATTSDKTFAVFNVKPGDVLNVRAEPDGKSKKVYSFGPSVKRVKLTGKEDVRDKTPWVEVSFEGGTGWVNRRYLTEVAPRGGCGDPELLAVIRAFMRAVATKNEADLAKLISPVQGLMVRYRQREMTAYYRGDEVDSLFTGSTPKNFGRADGSGEPIRGSFKKLILPGLQQSVAPGSKEKCGELLYGGSATINEWPDEFGALTMVSFYWPEGAREPWQTWAAGIEYVDGKPYVATLVGYRWEI